MDRANPQQLKEGRRIDYMLNHTNYKPIGAVKKIADDHKILFTVYQDK